MSLKLELVQFIDDTRKEVSVNVTLILALTSLDHL